MFLEKQGRLSKVNRTWYLAECIAKCRMPDCTDAPSWMDWEDPPTTWLFKTPFVQAVVDNSRQGLCPHLILYCYILYSVFCILCSVLLYSLFCVLCSVFCTAIFSILCSVFCYGQLSGQGPLYCWILNSVLCVLAVLSLCSTNFCTKCWQVHETVSQHSFTLEKCATILKVCSSGWSAGLSPLPYTSKKI